MRLRVVGFLVGGAVVGLAVPTANAQSDSSHSVPTTTDVPTPTSEPSTDSERARGSFDGGDGELSAGVGEHSAGLSGGSSKTSHAGLRPPLCDYHDAMFQRTGHSRSGLFEYRYIDQHFFRYSPSTGEAWIRMRYVCTDATGRTTTDYVWVGKADPDPRLLSESAFEQIKDKTVLVPVPALSPSSRGYVNLGMWLAIDEPLENPVSVTATAGNVSATTTAVLRQTVFDMGTGGPPIVCDGVGDPIPDDMLDSPEPSPVCGFTYVSTNDGVPYEVTVTAVWDVSWSSNIGLGGSLGVLERSTTVPYEVLQIQTVGGYFD
jgi:hypothetical protein